jgi:hypothetical protein
LWPWKTWVWSFSVVLKCHVWMVFQVWDIPWYDDDCIWVWDLTAPMHLGLINGIFVPHIKITGAL